LAVSSSMVFLSDSGTSTVSVLMMVKQR